ncbi:uncharacterized protein IL334_002692 [Kwoniella shivajii]|uniref:Glycosyltransferase 61 catalytic domain-containing protein n=1 Tax=Kwoniella shivajii TaxID=564305 RepID=A0ABZ1CWR2_9TREE|nr:hypothetical protein IL334_002692 [Kwoniella shivajii]
MDRAWWKRKNILIIGGLSLFLLSTWSCLHRSLSQWDHSIPADAFDSLQLSSPGSCQKASRLAGGVPGFYVLENLWYREGVFHLFTEDELIPEQDKIMSGYHEQRHHRFVDQEDIMAEQEGKIRCLDGQTMFLNDGADTGQRSYLNWFYHFAAEALLGGITSLSIAYPSTTNTSTLPRLIIPFEKNWRDKYGLNGAMIEGIFGDMVVEKAQWDMATRSGDWIGFEKVVIVDRYASHRYNPIANEWNKMALPIFSLLPSHPPAFFKPYRDNLLSSLNLKPESRVQPNKALKVIPKIIFVERQETNRRLDKVAYEGLLQVLEQFQSEEKAIIALPHLPELSFKEQVDSVKDADIIIGVHGNGLTHQMWMPEGGVVIELFVPNSFLRDYQVLSHALGHRHIAIWDDRILPETEWQLIDGELNPKMLHDGTAIPLDTSFIRTLLENLIVEIAR